MKRLICSKQDLVEYLREDKKALCKGNQKRPRWGRDEIWRFEILLRKTEYYTNCKKNIFDDLLYAYYKYRFHKMSVALGFSIPLNVFGKGLSIAHYGSIVVNHEARIGDNCRIQENVTIGSTGGSAKAPRIGNNVFIASGARIIGDLEIGDQCAIGANAVVTRSFVENHVTIAGVPAKVISQKGSDGFLSGELMKNIDYYSIGEA